MDWLRPFLLILLLALAGCADDPADDAADDADDEGPDAGDDGPDAGGDPDDEPGSDDGSANTPPEADLTSKSGNVTVPGNVTLSLDGSDADGDALSWSLLLDDEEIASGDALPAEQVHFLDAAGNYTFRLVVDDGNDTGEATLAIQGVAAPDLGPDPVSVSLDIAMSCFQCYITNVGPAPDNCVGLQQGENNQDCAWTAIDDSWRGREFTTDGPYDVDVAWYTSCEAGNEIETIGDEGHDAGVIHADAGCMVLWDWDANPEAGTIRIDIA